MLMIVMGLLVEGADVKGHILSSTMTDDKEIISAEYANLVRNFGELRKFRSTSELQVWRE